MRVCVAFTPPRGTAEAAGPVHQLDNQLPGRSVAGLPETWGEGPSESEAEGFGKKVWQDKEYGRKLAMIPRVKEDVVRHPSGFQMKWPLQRAAGSSKEVFQLVT